MVKLVNLDYLGGETDPEQERMLRPYGRESEFAWFVVNFGYTKTEYEQLTGLEKMFIYKKFEDKAVHETSLLHKAVHTAVYNNFRKKGKSAVDLFKKKTNWKKISGEEKAKYERILNNVRKADKKDSSWRDKIMRANRLKK